MAIWPLDFPTLSGGRQGHSRSAPGVHLAWKSRPNVFVRSKLRSSDECAAIEKQNWRMPGMATLSAPTLRLQARKRRRWRHRRLNRDSTGTLADLSYALPSDISSEAYEHLLEDVSELPGMRVTY